MILNSSGVTASFILAEREKGRERETDRQKQRQRSRITAERESVIFNPFAVTDSCSLAERIRYIFLPHSALLPLVF